MKISEQINQIIEARHQHLPEIEARLADLSEIEALLDQLDYVKNQMISPEGNILTNGKYAVLLMQNPDMAWNLQGTDTASVRLALKNARSALEECRHRFARESISVSVIGEARKGKSSLLKSISGLDDLVIPAFESTDCTGAPSIIYNDENGELDEGKVRATLTFKSKQQMLNMAQVYLNRLISNPAERIYLTDMEQIKSLNLDEILKKTTPVDPGLIVQSYLRKLIENYKEWSIYAGRVEPLVLEDKEEIATFVAQNNGIPVGTEGRKEFYKYLVVEKCEILCKFPEVEVGKLNLVDTVGLGDHTEGILEGMLHTVEHESDAVIFMIMPQNGAGGGVPQSVVEIYRQVVENCQDRDLSKWLFYMINHVEETKGSYAKNTEYCLSTEKMLEESKFFGYEHAKIVNATDSMAVREAFLVPMLLELSNNLEALDHIFVNKANETLKSFQLEYSILSKKAQKVLNSDFSHNTAIAPMLNRKSREGFEMIRGRIFQLVQNWSEKKTQPCPTLYKSSEHILDRMQQNYLKDTYIPDANDILRKLQMGVQPPQVFMDYENSIRNNVSRDFLNINAELHTFVEAMKNEVAEALYRDCGLEAVLKPDQSQVPYEWLKNFGEHVLDEVQYPTIKLAFDTLYQFDFSVKGFLTYEVRDGLNALDPRFSNLPNVVNNRDDPNLSAAANLQRMASNIQANLIGRLCVIASELDNRLEKLSCKPNLALFAEIIEFYDRLFFSDGVEDEWRNFFTENAGILWAEEIREKQATSVLCKDWMDLVDALLAKNMPSGFMQIR